MNLYDLDLKKMNSENRKKLLTQMGTCLEEDLPEKIEA
jgi:hypothetical protein